MAIEGKKINELQGLTSLTHDSVLPLVVVNDNIPESEAKKVTVQQLATYIGGSGGSVPTSYYYEYGSWTLSVDGKTLTIPDVSSSPKVWVFKNGVKLRPNTASISLDHDYYLNGTSLRFNTALKDTDVINLEVF